MKGELITKEYFKETLDTSLERVTDLMMNGFAHLNVKIDSVEERLDAKIDRSYERLDRKMDFHFCQLSTRIDDLAETKVSRPEFMALNGRVETLENVPKAA